MRHACTSLSRAAFASTIAPPEFRVGGEYRSHGRAARGRASRGRQASPNRCGDSAAELDDVLDDRRRVNEAANRLARVINEHVGVMLEPGGDGGIKRDELAGT